MQPLHATTHSPPPQLCAQRLLDVLPAVMRFVRKHMRSQRSRGLSVPQFRALFFLQNTPDANLSCVAEFLGASLPTASRIVTCLVAKGFVTRRASATDRRQVRLVLTGSGKTVMEKARRVTQERLATELQSLDAEDRSALLRAMDGLSSVFAPALRTSGSQSIVAGAS
jgi:DNA-binding MarR family transcriptional regulator